MIVGLHVVVRSNYWKVLCTLYLVFPNDNILCDNRTLSNPGNFDTGTIHRCYSDFTSFICTCVCMCMCVYVVPWDFVICIEVCNHHCNQNIGLIHHYKDPLCYPLVVIPTPSTLCHLWSMATSNLFYISMILSFKECYNLWNYTAGGLLRLEFSTLHNALEIHSSCCANQEFIPFYCWVVFHGMDVYSLFNHAPLRDIWVVSSLRILQRFYEHLYAHVCVDKLSISLGEIPRSAIAGWYGKYAYI